MYWSILYELTSKGPELSTPEALGELVAQVLSRGMGLSAVALYVLEESTSSLALAASHPDPTNLSRIPVGEITEDFLEGMRTATVPLLDFDSSQVVEMVPELSRVGRDNRLDTCLALVYRDRWLGVLGLGGRTLDAPEYEFLALLTRVVGVMLANQQFASMALMDYTTGLHSSRYFVRRVEQELKRATRYGYPFSLVVMDLDDFKAVNDTYGHQVGDKVLKEVAEILRRCCRRDVDVVARYGGEEFVFLLPHTVLDGAKVMAERVLQTLASQPIALGSPVTMSAGISCYPQDGSDYPGLFAVADARLYAAKRAGKNQVVVGA